MVSSFQIYFHEINDYPYNIVAFFSIISTVMVCSKKKGPGGFSMQQRVAVIGIIIENRKSIDELNHIISEYSEYIVGRMGIPYHKRGISIICLSVDAPQDKISGLSGRIGRLDGISAKTAYSNAVFEDY